MKKSKLLLTSLMLASVLAGCKNNVSSEVNSNNKNSTAEVTSINKNPKVKQTTPENKTTTTKEVKKNDESLVDIFNRFAKKSKSTEEIYVTGDVKVGQDKDVNPGIYDLEITGGSGNIMGDRKDFHFLFINFLGGAPDSGSNHPSKIRLILFEGDTLKFSNISKIKFNAVPEKVEMNNTLGFGEYIVGRDIKAGTYKLSTNMKMDPEFKNLGWDIDIYNNETKRSRKQSYTPGNPDVVLKLEDGEIISTQYDHVEYGASADDAKLIFTQYK